jgi:hypothetical protein
MPTRRIICDENSRRLATCVRDGRADRRFLSQRGLFYRVLKKMLTRRMHPLKQDRHEQEQVVINSGPAWTIFKPPRRADTAKKLCPQQSARTSP